MTHLSKKQIQDILEGKPPGIDLAEALFHMEECPDCRSAMPSLERSELKDLIMRQAHFEVDESLLPEAAFSKEPAYSFFGWMQRPIVAVGFATIVLVIIGGIIYFSIGGTQNNSNMLAVNSSITPLPKETPPTPTNSDIERASSGNENTRPLQGNQNLPAIANSDEDLSNKKIKNNEPERPLPDQNAKDKDEDNKQPGPQQDYFDGRELALNLKQIPDPLKDLATSGVTPRGDSKNSGRLFAKYPVGEVVRETRPTLRWSAVKNASSYSVILYDEDYNELSRSEVRATSFTLKEALGRGGKYLWQVKANINTSENSELTSPPVMFKVAGEKVIQRVDKIDPGNSKLWKKANALFKEGLLNDTEKTLNQILKKNPKDRNAIKLLQRIFALRKKNQSAPSETKPAQ